MDISSASKEKGYNRRLSVKFKDMKDKLIVIRGLNKESIGWLDALSIKKVLTVRSTAILLFHP